MTRPE